MKNCNIALTGLPHSGKTLTCHLLNKLPDVVALDEPMAPRKLARWKFHVLICNRIERFFTKSRESLCTRRTAISRHVSGEVIPKPDEVMRQGGAKGEIRFDKALSPNFLLVINHGPGFTALLETLSKRVPTVAVIRNPLAVLASWNSVPTRPFLVSSGHAPAAERLDKGLRQTLARLSDRTERQIHLLSWFFERYRKVLPEASILRYEDIVSSEGRALSLITPYISSLDVALENRNKERGYDQELLHTLGRRLLETDGPYWTFYTRESVEQLLQE